VVTRVLLASDAPSGADAESRLLALAAAVERCARHPLARAVTSEADARRAPPLPVEDATLPPGARRGRAARVQGRDVAVGSLAWLRELGVTGDPSAVPQSADAVGSTRVYVAVDGRMAGEFVVADALRGGARDTVAALRSMGLRVVLLSGDRPDAAAALGAAIGLLPADIHGGVRPAGKADFVAALQAGGAKVAMVGDGVDDTAALARADCGIALASSVGAAFEVANIVLLRDNSGQVVDALQLSRRHVRQDPAEPHVGLCVQHLRRTARRRRAAAVAGRGADTSAAAALMGFSSLGVMANSLSLQLHGGRLGSRVAQARVVKGDDAV
jgi:Cu2+-exporting ATPase